MISFPLLSFIIRVPYAIAMKSFCFWTFSVMNLCYLNLLIWTFWFDLLIWTLWYGPLICISDLIILMTYDLCHLWHSVDLLCWPILLTYYVWPILVWHPSQIYFTRHGGSMFVSEMHLWHDSRAVEWCSATSPFLLYDMRILWYDLLWPIWFLWGRMDAS